MKTKFIFFNLGLLLFVNIPEMYSQDFFNPYRDYNGQQIEDLTIPWYSDYTRPTTPSYNGEYEIMLGGNDMPWANTNLFYPSGLDFNNFMLTYSIEVVSFPFINECVFEVNGCGQPANRELTVPDDSRYNGSNIWTYSPLPFFATDLRRISNKTMNRDPFMTSALSNQLVPDILATFGFMKNNGIADHTQFILIVF